jgi:triosephosphate isomerase (TIM)
MNPFKHIPLVIGNWKLNGDRQLIDSELAALMGHRFQHQIAICPPYTLIADMVNLTQGSGLLIGAQNFSEYEKGAYTGEISAGMLAQVGCQLSLIGHSERRALFGETDVACNTKLKAALNHGMTPVLCVGENKEQRATNKTYQILRQQLVTCLNNIDLISVIQKQPHSDFCIAYEPLWAIGTGLAATPEMAREAHAFIRAEAAMLYDVETANRIRILYGGSVTKNNVTELMSQQDINGVLVGGASLDPAHFLAICQQVSASVVNCAAQNQ